MVEPINFIPRLFKSLEIASDKELVVLPISNMILPPVKVSR
jgi:hypothetical protein